VIGEDLSWFRVFVNGLVEERDDVLGCAVFEDLATCDVSAVVVEDCDEPSCWWDDLEVALPEAVRMSTLPAPVASSVSGCLEWVVQSSLLE